CKRGDTSAGTDAAPSDSSSAAGEESVAPVAAPTTSSSPALQGRVPVPDGPIVGVVAGQANILAEPNAPAKRRGYLHLRSVRARESAEPVGKSGCPGGWYKVRPRGFVCVGEEATIDPNHPVLRAAANVRPDRVSALPYRYGFVRAVLPLYLRAPSRDDQQ